MKGMIDTLEKEYGLLTLLDDSKFEGTVFALTDKACRQMEAKVEGLSEMADIIRYHVVPSDRLTSKSLPKKADAWETELVGHDLQASRKKKKSIEVVDEQGQKVRIRTSKGTKAGKSIIYEVKKALQPDLS